MTFLHIRARCRALSESARKFLDVARLKAAKVRTSTRLGPFHSIGATKGLEYTFPFASEASLPRNIDQIFGSALRRYCFRTTSPAPFKRRRYVNRVSPGNKRFQGCRSFNPAAH